MTVKDAANALGISPWTVRSLCRQGKLPARRKRKSWFISRPLVKALAEEMQGGVPNEAYLEWEREHGKISDPQEQQEPT